MYIPEHFRLDDRAAQLALMRAYPFAALVSSGAAGFEVTHLPTVAKVEGEAVVVEAHMARANPHWRALQAEPKALFVYTGPEAYVTPGWYPGKQVHGKVVPTWNYAVVHAHGDVAIVDDRDWLVRHVAEITDQQEAGTPAPWATSDAPGNFIEVMARGIVGVRLTVTRLEGKAKMSQNREPADRTGVVAGLEARGSVGDAAVADAVRRTMTPQS